jgi:F-type H+-transporting ATPase subunit b
MHLWSLYSATTSAGISGLFTALGIDWRSLILDALAFLITMAILAKFVYPILIKALDAKQDELEAATRLEKQAKSDLETAQKEITKLMEEARKSADEVLANAKTEAANATKVSSQHAAEQAERIVAEAHEQLKRDVRVARETLKTDTVHLVASATETLLGEKLNATTDAKLINKSLEQAGSRRS